MWMMSKNKPDCIRCGYVLCHPNNAEVMNIIFKYFTFMFTGFGTPSIQAIETILNREGLYDDREIYEKILIYMKQAIKVQNEESKKPKTVYTKKGTIAG
jgi:hypothetical protein